MSKRYRKILIVAQTTIIDNYEKTNSNLANLSFGQKLEQLKKVAKTLLTICQSISNSQNRVEPTNKKWASPKTARSEIL